MTAYFATGAALTTALNALPAATTGSYQAFDAFYYANTYMGSYTGTLSPIEHFVQIGSARGYAPNATFNPSYYQSQYPDLAGLDAASLLYHFVAYGMNEGRVPNASLAGVNWTAYLAQYPAVAAYVNANLAMFHGSVTNGAIAHYEKFGQYQGFTLPAAATTTTLTTGVDTLVGSASGTTFNGILGGSAPTLTPFDNLTGGSGTDTLNLVDSTASSTDALPAGIAMAAIENLVFTTVGNAGTSSAKFDTTASGISGLTSLTVSSSGANSDYIKAATSTNVTDTNLGGGASVTGGLNNNVTAKGAITMSGSVGTISATNTSNTAVAVTIDGGTSVSVNSKGTGSGAVVIGGTTAPSGAVTVTETATGGVSVKGGTSNTITVNGGAVTLGGTTATNPTGAVSVTQNISSGAVTVNGGAAVTVNTTGGAVAVGSSTSGVGVATGAVSVTDTSALAQDAISVYGGSSVAITSTANNGTITVGATGTTTVAGTALSNAAYTPTGNVTIVNNTGSAYGSSTTNVFTNGGTAVSVTGGASSGNTITDIETTAQTAGANVGLAVGTSTLNTVSLNKIGATAITSDALTTVNLTNTNAAMVDTVTPAHALTVNLSKSGASDSIQDDSATSITFTAAGGYATGATTETIAVAAGTSSSSKVASLIFNNTDSLTLASATSLGGSSTVTSTSITAQGSGALALGDLHSLSKLSSINASTSSGTVSVELNGNQTSFTGGSGNDTVTLDTGLSKSISAGTGTSNTLVVQAAQSTFEPTLGATTSLHTLTSNFQNLSLKSGAYGTFTATGFSNVKTYAQTGNHTITLSGADAGESVTIATNNKGTGNAVIYALTTSTGTNDTLSATVGVDGTSGGVVGTGSGSSSVWLSTSGVENIALTSAGDAITSRNWVTLSDTTATTSAIKTLTIGGDAAITVYNEGNTTIGSGASTTISLNSITVTNTGATDVSNLTLKSTGATILGGAGQLTAAGSTASGSVVDVISTGSGGGVITVGTGGATATFSSGVPASAGSGSETVDLSLSTTTQDVIKVADSDVVTIKNFQITASPSTSDVLTFATAAKTTISDVSTASTSTGVSNLSYTSQNGVITFVAATGHALTEFTNANFIAAAEYIVAAGGANKSAAFALGSDEYVIASDASGNAGTVVDLQGDAGISGFGLAPTATTLITAGTVAAQGAIGTAVSAAPAASAGTQSLVFATPTTGGTQVFTYAVGGVAKTVAVTVATTTTAAAIVTALNANTTFATYAVASSTGLTNVTITNKNPGVSTYTGIGTITNVTAVLGTTLTGGVAYANGSGIQLNVGDASSTTAAAGTGALTLAGTPAAANAAKVYTVTGLASSDIINVTGAYNITDGTTNPTYSVGSVTTTKTGSTGATYLNLAASTADTGGSSAITQQTLLDTLTLSGDSRLIINSASAISLAVLDLASDKISSIVDGGTTKTLSEIDIIGATPLTIAGITDTALKTIDASASTGGVTLTGQSTVTGVTIKASTTGTTAITDDANNTTISQSVTGTGAVTVTSAAGNGDVITLGTGNNTITAANGVGDTITIGGTTTAGVGTGGSNTITAADGAGTTIKVYQAAGSQLTITSAAGAGDTITVMNGAADTGTSSAITAKGASDVIDVSGFTGASGHIMTVNTYVSAAADGNGSSILLGTYGTAVVGKNNTVILAAGGNDIVDVSNTATGATSSGSYAMTTINGPFATSDTIKFDSHAVFASTNILPVDVSSATTLGAALDLAASSAAYNVTWFQYGGNTYLVENTPNATGTALTTTDIVVKLTGTVDLSHATISSHVVTL